MSRLLAHALTLICVALLARDGSAQSACGTWSPGFAAPELPGVGLAAFDDGGGVKAYTARPDALVRWTGTTWEPVFGPSQAGRTVSGVWSSVAAGVPVLVVTESSLAPLTSHVWRWDGTSWTALGSSAGNLYELEYLDDGTGEQLFALVFASSTNRFVARWNGAAWSVVGQTFTRSLWDLGALRVAGVSTLYLGGERNLVGASSVASWNGSTWTPVPGVNEDAIAIESFDAGAGERLYVATSPTSFVGHLYPFDGTSWGPSVPNLARLQDLEVADLGQGPRLLGGAYSPTMLFTFDGATVTPLGPGLPTSAGGSHARFVAAGLDAAGPHVFANGLFDEPLNGVVANTFLAWDGSDWSTTGRGLARRGGGTANVYAFARHDFGSGLELVLAGSFDHAGGAGGQTFLSGATRWDGAQWRKLGTNGIGSGQNSTTFGYALASVDFGQGPELFCGGQWLQNIPFRPLVRWNGSAWSPPLPGNFGTVHALCVFDDGNGPKLYAGGQVTRLGGGPGDGVFGFDGTNGFALGAGIDNVVAALAVHDDGAGAVLFAGGAFTQAGGAPAANIARWDGAAWSPLGAGTNGGVNSLASFAGALYAGGAFTNAGGVAAANIARWDGTAWSDVPGGGANGLVDALHVHDDGRGPALYAGGSFSAIGGITAYNLARFDGTAWEAVDGGLDDTVFAFASYDDDGDGDEELFAGGRFTRSATLATGRIARLEGCPHYASFCAGDGTLADHTTPCPCGNDGAPGHGCASGANANGGLLAAQGTTSADTLVLLATEMPVSAFGLYLQHDAADDRVFHDGVICAGGNLLRLRNRNASGGASQFPDPFFAQDATLTLSQRGGVAPGSGATRYYSVFYRSPAATFCPPATANVTNGIRVIW